jgi:leucyl aminopeptidase
MNYHVKTGALNTQRVDCIVIGIFEARQLSDEAKSLDTASKGALTTWLKQGDLEGKVGQTAFLYDVPGIHTTRLLLVGCGKSKDLTIDTYQTIIDHMYSALKSLPIKTLVCTLINLPVGARDIYWTTRFTIETIAYKQYRFEGYKSKPKKDSISLSEVTMLVDKKNVSTATLGIKHATTIAQAIRTCRDLGNTPPNICTPSYLADQAKGLAKKHPALTATILGEAEMKKLGMRALLAVGNGSQHESKLIALHYKGGKKSDAPIMLVGKGVTFDTGGISIKTSDGMLAMKMDMCGAASVLATMQAVAELNLPLNVSMVIPSVENMPDGNAYKPSDIITSYSGTTIEIQNTDAEGRVILCDALTYALEFKPKVMIDVATLTGAIITSLGHELTGLFGNNKLLINALIEAGEQSNDGVWQMPLNAKYQKHIDSTVADIKNMGTKGVAGSIAAACFLERFVEKTHWAHLDVAGTAMEKDATGRPVSLLVQYLLNQSK